MINWGLSDPPDSPSVFWDLCFQQVPFFVLKSLASFTGDVYYASKKGES